MKMRIFRLSSIMAAACVIILVSGCQEDEIRQYKVLRQTKKGIQYEVPPTWEKFANPGAFAKAKYLIKGDQKDEKAEFSISAFPGKAGGLLLNVDRWRKQVKLEPHKNEAELAKNMEKIKVAGKTAYYVDLQGPIEAGESRILGVILHMDEKNNDGKTWFFKMTGPKNLVEREKPRFEAMLETVTFGDNDGKES